MEIKPAPWTRSVGAFKSKDIGKTLFLWQELEIDIFVIGLFWSGYVGSVSALLDSPVCFFRKSLGLSVT